MTNLLAKYRRWQSKKAARRVNEWPTKRSKGKRYFVISSALKVCFTSTSLLILVDLVYGDPLTLSNITSKIIITLLAGFWVGHGVWNAREREYLQNQYMETLSDLAVADKQPAVAGNPNRGVPPSL